CKGVVSTPDQQPRGRPSRSLRAGHGGLAAAPPRAVRMRDGQLGAILRYIRTLTAPGCGAPTTDAELLRQFVARRDEAAFAALMERHGPMVLGVCRRLLRQPQDVDDVFQATFLVLLQRAESIASADSVGSWLYGVARRIAVRVRANVRKRQQREGNGLDTLP